MLRGMSKVTTREARIHGHRIVFREAGRGPVVLLVHGVAGSSQTWNAVIPKLAKNFHVIAPDMLGHGQSDKPRGDYSLGAQASGLRDLLELLGHRRVNVVGHSLGGGIVMQFTYQFPERCQRMVLVSSGGLGREVTPLLRAATLPGAEWVLPLIAHQRLVGAARPVVAFLSRTPARPGRALQEFARSYATLADAQARASFLHTLRSVVDAEGQRVDASDRLYLAATLPVLLVWGARDRFIPVAHGRDAQALIPGSRLEVFERAGHFPHLDEPDRFAQLLYEFAHSTEPARSHRTAVSAALARSSTRRGAVAGQRAG